MARIAYIVFSFLAAFSMFLTVLNAMPLLWPFDNVTASIVAAWGVCAVFYLVLQARKAFNKEYV